MTRMLATVSAALLGVAAAASVANADPMTMMQGFTACNTSYSQCVAAADMSIAPTPAAGLEKIKMNMMHGSECGKALQACYATVR